MYRTNIDSLLNGFLDMIWVSLAAKEIFSRVVFNFVPDIIIRNIIRLSFLTEIILEFFAVTIVGIISFDKYIILNVKLTFLQDLSNSLESLSQIKP